jgi:TPR repeat protein
VAFGVELDMQTSSKPATEDLMQNRHRILGPLALLSLALSLPSGATAGRASAVSLGPPLLVAAQQAYYEGRYAQSLVMFERLAAQQNAEAAECAGFMLLNGDALYGIQVRRNVPRAKALLLQAASLGRPGAAFMLNMLERTD